MTDRDDSDNIADSIERLEDLATEILARANVLEEALSKAHADRSSTEDPKQPPSDAFLDKDKRRYLVMSFADGTWRFDQGLLEAAARSARENKEPRIEHAAEQLLAQHRDSVIKGYGMTPKEPPAKWLYMTDPPTAAPRPNTAQPMGAAARYARTGALDVQALANRVVDAFGRLSRDEPLTSLEAALVTLLYPKDFDFMDESAARMIALISDDEKEQVRERVVARVKELSARNYTSYVPGQHVTLASR
jgi:hypothetical protein